MIIDNLLNFATFFKGLRTTQVISSEITDYSVLRTIHSTIVDTKDTYPYLHTSKDINIDDYTICHNDLVVETLNGLKVGLIICPPSNIVTNSNQIIIRVKNPELLLPEFLLYYLLTPDVLKYLAPLRRGSCITFIGVDDLKSLPIPILEIDKQLKWIQLNKQVGIYQQRSHNAIDLLKQLPQATLRKLCKQN